MKKTYIYPLVILLFTILPIIIDFSISHERHYPFIWSVFLIPSILIMFSYPNWKIIIGTGLFYTALKYTAELSQNLQLDFKDDAILLWSSLVNWAILLLVGYLRIQNEKLLNKIHCLALIDPLTDTYNRRYFDLYIQETVIDISKTGKQLLIIALDIDHFKKINDHYGHLCGDEALKHLVTIVKKNIRATDMFARIGGEEFILTLTDTSLEDGMIIIERIRKQVASSSFIYKGQAIPITISLGLTEYKRESIEQVLEKADKALYQAKETGRNKWVIG